MKAPAIFYSWQSDLANNTNRGLIETSLELAIAEIASDATLDVCPRLDDAGTDVVGAHDIAATILKKIEAAAVFVADVSIIGNATPTRPTPNPNVLIEVGYALKTLGPDRVILLFNQASGRVEDLPFDLRPRMTMAYRAEPGDTEQAQAERRAMRKNLGKGLANVIRAILDRDKVAEPPALSLSQRAIDGVSQSSSDRRARIAEYLTEVANEIERRLPTPQGDHSDDALVKNIEETVGLVQEFANLAEMIGRTGASDAAVAATRGLEKIMQLYDLAPPRHGPADDTDFDLPKFIGHELFVVLVAALLRHEAFDAIGEVLDVDLYVERHGGRETRSWVELSKFCRLLRHRSDRLQLRLLSLHGSVLQTRHASDTLKTVSPFSGFIEADYFLFLASSLHQASKPFEVVGTTWRAWSLAYMRWVEPTFLVRAHSKRFAETLMKPLRIKTVEELRTRYAERGFAFARLFDNWGMSVDGGMNAELIASKP